MPALYECMGVTGAEFGVGYDNFVVGAQMRPTARQCESSCSFLVTANQHASAGASSKDRLAVASSVLTNGSLR